MLTPASVKRPASRPNKYGVSAKADRTLDGVVFDSKREMQRFAKLQQQEKAGLISGLRRQVPLRIDVNGQHICKYIADFVYRESGKEIFEDSKGVRTDVFKLKKRLVQAVLGITIKETK